MSFLAYLQHCNTLLKEQMQMFMYPLNTDALASASMHAGHGSEGVQRFSHATPNQTSEALGIEDGARKPEVAYAVFRFVFRSCRQSCFYAILFHIVSGKQSALNNESMPTTFRLNNYWSRSHNTRNEEAESRISHTSGALRRQDVRKT